MTAALKKYYPIYFMTALLTAEEKEEKIENYISVAESMGITIRVPDINLSNKEFTPHDNNILFGLGSIKGVGETSIPEIIENRPYTSIANVIEKVSKKSFNKRVGIALIKSGAFDSINPNRYELINEFYDLRKDKDDRLDPDEYSEYACADMEKDILGAPITYKPWWNQIEAGQKVNGVMEIIDIQEKNDKNGNLMAFAKFKYNNCSIRAIIFSSTYCKSVGYLDPQRNIYAEVTGKKDDKGTLIVSKVAAFKKEEHEISERFYRLLI